MSLVKEFVRSAYVQNSEGYIAYRRSSESIYRQLIGPLLQRVVSALEKPRPTILDLGCGFFYPISRSDVGGYVGIDISDGLLERHIYRNTRDTLLVKADLSSGLPVRPNVGTDMVSGILFLNYLDHPGVLLSQVRRSGLGFAFVVPNSGYDLRLGHKRAQVTDIEFLGMNFSYYSRTLDELVALIQPAVEIKIDFSSLLGSEQCPPYVCISGRW